MKSRDETTFIEVNENGVFKNGEPIPIVKTDGSGVFELIEDVAVEVSQEKCSWIELQFADGLNRLCLFEELMKVNDKWSALLGLEGIPLPSNWRDDPKWVRWFAETDKEFLANTDHWKFVGEKE